MDLLQLTHVLGRKVLLYILIVSSILTLLTTSIQLYSDYRYDISEIETRFQEIESSHLDSLALNLWDFQDKAVEQQLSGIQRLPFINYVQLNTPQGATYDVGSIVNKDTISRMFEVKYEGIVIGFLRVDANYNEIYTKLIQKTGIILLTQLFKTLLAALAIVSIVYWFITRHIYKIAKYGSDFSLSKLETSLKLEGNRKHKDELDHLVDSLNTMREIIKSEFERRQALEAELNNFNHELELQVKSRTLELESSITQLQDAQYDLVRSEKMAALGQLVAGVAHEINTPLGISITAQSVLTENLEHLSLAIKKGSLSKSKLLNYIEEQKETSEMLERNLFRAIELIKSFKSVAVNQTSDSFLDCEFEKLISEVLATVQTMFKARDYKIEVTTPKNLYLLTYPGVWVQILTNLLMNSHIHGFENKPDGQIKILVEVFESNYRLTYQDDGNGIPSDIIDRVFDPFVTTKRGKGGSGLGLNILFNLVYEKLNGSVQVKNLEQGCMFVIECPINLKAHIEGESVESLD